MRFLAPGSMAGTVPEYTGRTSFGDIEWGAEEWATERADKRTLYSRGVAEQTHPSSCTLLLCSKMFGSVVHAKRRPIQAVKRPGKGRDRVDAVIVVNHLPFSEYFVINQVVRTRRPLQVNHQPLILSVES